jgi:hypothetical protein
VAEEVVARGAVAPVIHIDLAGISIRQEARHRGGIGWIEGVELNFFGGALGMICAGRH